MIKVDSGKDEFRNCISLEHLCFLINMNWWWSVQSEQNDGIFYHEKADSIQELYLAENISL